VPDLTRLKQLLEQKTKAIAAAAAGAAGIYTVEAVQHHTPLTLAGLIAAVVASPAIGAIVHRAPANKPARAKRSSTKR
jgi:hypothetical protein